VGQYDGTMRELIAGDGGSVLVAAASLPSAAALACEGLALGCSTPSGLPVHPLGSSVPDVDRVRLLPCEGRTRERVYGWGLEVVEASVPLISCSRPVVTVEAASTGAGKTALTRRIARTLVRSRVSAIVARHPIAGLLLWDRFDPVVVRTPPELASGRPLEEREELAPLVGAGVPVVVGLDMERVLRLAAQEADVVVWDGGGAAAPYVDGVVRFLAIDLLRPRTVDPSRVASADVVVLCKADSAPEGRAREIEAQVREINGEAQVILADLTVGVHPGAALTDSRVVIVEDASSLMLGGLSAGAGAVAARRFRCGVVDPRPFAVGAIADALQTFSHIGAVIPSLGRTTAEIDDLAASVAATPGEVVLWASNADPASVLRDETRPIVRAYGELTEVAGPSLQEVLTPLIPGHA
jgi:predicted GTPase